MVTKKYTCGTIIPSGCVPYTGSLPDFIDPDDIDCDANIDEIFDAYGDKIDEILAGLDLTNLTPGCLIFDPATVTSKDLHTLEIEKLCDHETRISDLEEEFTDLNIGNLTVGPVDLGCLATDAAPCEGPANVYSLISLIRLFASELCVVKQAVAVAGSSTSGTSGTSGGSGIDGTSGTGGTSGTSGQTGTSGTTGTTPPPLGIGTVTQYADLVGDVCSQPFNPIFTTTGDFDTGDVVYTDPYLMIPLTGINFIRRRSDDAIFSIDSGTGQVGASTGSFCS